MKILFVMIVGLAIVLLARQVIVVPVQVDQPLGSQPLEPPVRPSYSLEFSQLGFLTPDAGENKILPLFGRRLQRDRWQYYTISNQHNDIQVPIKVGKRSGLDSVGVEELSSGDRVLVHGYNEMFTVSLYDTDVRRYF